LLDAGAGPLPDAQASTIVTAGDVAVGVLAAGLGDKPAETIAARSAQLRKDGARVVVLLAHPRGGSWQAAQQLAQSARGAVDLVVLGHLDDPATDPNRAEPGPPPL